MSFFRIKRRPSFHYQLFGTFTAVFIWGIVLWLNSITFEKSLPVYLGPSPLVDNDLDVDRYVNTESHRLNYIQNYDLKSLKLITLRSFRVRQRITEELLKKIKVLELYHSVGIEGNSLSSKEIEKILRFRQGLTGKKILEINEVIGLDWALKKRNELARNKSIDLKDILDLHKRSMGPVSPLIAGKIRQNEVIVGNYLPPKPEYLFQLTNSFINWLNSDETLKLNAIKRAALAHLKLVQIHPFSDGNGRTSRLIMNLILIQTGLPITIIDQKNKLEYYNRIKMANLGDPEPFISFIADCLNTTLKWYENNI